MVVRLKENNSSVRKRVDEAFVGDRLIQLMSAYDNEVDAVTAEELGREMSYHKLVKTVGDARSFNYRSDYWGDADTYQRDIVDFMRKLEPLVGNTCILDEDSPDDLFKVVGLLIDKQYTSLNHCKVLVTEAESSEEGSLGYEIKTISMDVAVREGSKVSGTDSRGDLYRDISDVLSKYGYEMAGDFLNVEDGLTGVYIDNGYQFFSEE